MNVCDTSFERAKTALLRGGDVLDFSRAQFTREKREILYLAKISRYMVFVSLNTIIPATLTQYAPPLGPEPNDGTLPADCVLW